MVNTNIPTGWSLVKIDDISKVIRGASPRPKGDPRYYGGSVPRLMVADVTRDYKFVTPTTDFLTEEGAKLSRPMPAGSLVVVCSGTVGVPAILAVDACIHDGFLALKDIDNKCNKEYLFYIFSHLKSKFDSSATHGGVFTNLTTQILRDFDFLLPPILEQHKIANILTSVDIAISQTEAIIKQTEKVKKGLLQQLLTKGIGHTNFKHTEIGQVPDTWAIQSFHNLFNIKHGHAFKSEYFTDNGELVLLTPGNFEAEGGLKLKGDKEKYYIGDFPLDYLLNKGDLLVVMTDLTQDCNILGSPAFIAENNKFLHNQRLGKVTDLNQSIIQAEYLYLLFNSAWYRNHLKSTATGTTVRHTSPSRILEVQAPIPPIAEQVRIVQIIKSVQDKKTKEIQKLSNLQALKKGLMQVLLTGEVRVKVDNQEVVIG